MKKLILKIFIILISLTVCLGTVIMVMDEPIPEGVKGDRAEFLADKMLEALNKPSWDSLESISWKYPIGNHRYIWDKFNNEVTVIWDNYKVIINTQNHTGKAWKEDKLLDDNDLVSKAFKYFNNDSFWLIAPYKIKDPGTIRKVVNFNGNEALLVQYTTGGTTPGDSYLWILDDNYRPIAWKFWASIIPIGGMEFTWEGWVDIEGAQISTNHKGLIDIAIEILDN